MVIKLPRSRESTPVAVTPPSTTLVVVTFIHWGLRSGKLPWKLLDPPRWYHPAIWPGGGAYEAAAAALA